MPHVLEHQCVLYAADNATYRQLIAFSQQAHETTAAGDAARVREIKAEIDQLAKELWGLSQQELEEIQRSLEELR